MQRQAERGTFITEFKNMNFSPPLLSWLVRSLFVTITEASCAAAARVCCTSLLSCGMKRFYMLKTCSLSSQLTKLPGSKSLFSQDFIQYWTMTDCWLPRKCVVLSSQWCVPCAAATAICRVPAATVCSLFYHFHLKEPHSQLEKGDPTANQPPEPRCATTCVCMCPFMCICRCS